VKASCARREKRTSRRSTVAIPFPRVVARVVKEARPASHGKQPSSPFQPPSVFSVKIARVGEAAEAHAPRCHLQAARERATVMFH